MPPDGGEGRDIGEGEKGGEGEQKGAGVCDGVGRGSGGLQKEKERRLACLFDCLRACLID